MLTNNMKELLQKVADLCYQASDKVIENEETKEILNTCDILVALIDKYFDGEAIT